MRLLEHGDECPHISPAEVHLPGLERAVEMEREVAVPLGHAGVRGRRRGDRVHEVTRNRDDLAVEAELDHLLLLPVYRLPRGLKA